MPKLVFRSHALINIADIASYSKEKAQAGKWQPPLRTDSSGTVSTSLSAWTFRTQPSRPGKRLPEHGVRELCDHFPVCRRNGCTKSSLRRRGCSWRARYRRLFRGLHGRGIIAVQVDAPLDDNNVERFCAMMEEMAKSTDTRFLVITHQPMTMSRMNRLFGVTMMEKGVSQLVSVDLQTGIKFREAS